MQIDATHLTSLFENATEGIILTNQHGLISLVNPAAERMFGYESKELEGSSIEVLIPDHLRVRHKSMRTDFYKMPTNRVMGHGRDLHGKRKDGSDMPVEVSLSFYRREEQLFVIAFIVDITERKKIEEDIRMQQSELEKMAVSMRKLNSELERKVEERTLILKEALQKLEESQKELSEALDKEKQLNEIKSRFVSMASHEFRTPLSTVLSSASLLSRYTGADEQDKRERHIQKIKGSVKHLNDILEDFLSLGKLDEGKVNAQPAEFNFQDFLEDVIDEMKGLTKKGQQIELKSDCSASFFSDKKLLKNVLINLLSNAIKFSPEDSRIGVNCTVSDDRALIEVSDRGIGISEEDMEHLFSSFYRAKNAVNIQGTGMGLHIVKRYLDLLGGSIDVKSELNKGTTFYIALPSTPDRS
jgi:PAS domain S-box-containing protein